MKLPLFLNVEEAHENGSSNDAINAVKLAVVFVMKTTPGVLQGHKKDKYCSFLFFPQSISASHWGSKEC